MTLYTLAGTLLANVLDALNECGRPRPKHHGVVPSGGLWEPSRCCEGHAWARLLPLAPVAVAPAAATCADQAWTATIEAGVARCPAAGPKGVMGAVKFPEPAELAASAAGQLADAQALAAAAARTVAGWDDEDVGEDATGHVAFYLARPTVGQVGWLNTATCLGATVQVRVEVSGMCCAATVGPVSPPVTSTS